jgi:tetratricopeptide (TPR) repeat protein
MSQSAHVDDLLKSARRSMKEGELDFALEQFREALALDELRADGHEGLATASFMKKDYPEAVKHFTRVTQLDPIHGKAWINLGAVYNRMHEHQKAVDALRKGVQKERKSHDGYYNLGIAYKGLNQLAMAVSAYREALRLNPQMAEAHANLANVYVDQGNLQQAITHYKQALEIRPDFERARRGLEHAQEASTAAKQAISPFGRLVDTEAAARGKATAFQRKLNDEERAHDRHAISLLCPDLDLAASNLNQHLKTDLERGLLVLSRAVAQGLEGRSALLDAADEFRITFQRCQELRRSLKRKTLELRAHEEVVCTPEIGSEVPASR